MYVCIPLLCCLWPLGTLSQGTFFLIFTLLLWERHNVFDHIHLLLLPPCPLRSTLPSWPPAVSLTGHKRPRVDGPSGTLDRVVSSVLPTPSNNPFTRKCYQHMSNAVFFFFIRKTYEPSCWRIWSGGQIKSHLIQVRKTITSNQRRGPGSAWVGLFSPWYVLPARVLVRS